MGWTFSSDREGKKCTRHFSGETSLKEIRSEKTDRKMGGRLQNGSLGCRLRMEGT